MSEQRASLYQQVGGEETVDRIMNNLFDIRLPQDKTTDPPVWDLFGRVANNKKTLTMHKHIVGSLLGELFGDQHPRFTVTSDELSEWHEDCGATKAHFDVVMKHLVEAIREEIDTEAEAAVETLQGVSQELQAAIVHDTKNVQNM